MLYLSKISYIDCTHINYHIDPKLVQDIEKAFHERLLNRIDDYLYGAITMTSTNTSSTKNNKYILK